MSEQLADPNAADETIEVTLGRRAPFSQLGDWVLFSGGDSDARTLYWGLSAHINTSERGDNEVWPGLATLARILQLKKPENVSKFMLQLEVIGAIEVSRTMVGLVRRNRYIVHQTPPASHTGARSTSEWYALNRGPKGETAEARKEREAQFDRWLTAVRDSLKAHCDKVAKARAAAKKAKATMPPVELFVAPLLTDFRTPWGGGTARPAVIQETAGQLVPPGQGVRTPWGGGSVPPGQGVERDQEELDQSLSLVRASSEHPADPAEATKKRESSAARKTTKAASPSAAPVPEQRQGNDELEQKVGEVVKAYVTALGSSRPMPTVMQRLRTDASELLALNWPVDHVVRLAGQLPSLGYSSLARHAEHNPPKTVATPGHQGGGRQTAIEACSTCDEYGQIDFGNRIAKCRHDAPAPVPADGPALEEAPEPAATKPRLRDLIGKLAQANA
ncbi:hypothetical protein [Streptomyces sp. NPDC001930]|uniref:hypothetical protein n=1 Tax=Streptomyces sp. NPDC001930 TaxID=3364625 RepID=UPI0036CF0A54